MFCSPGEGSALQVTAAACVEAEGSCVLVVTSAPAPQSWWDKLTPEIFKGHSGTHITLLLSDLFLQGHYWFTCSSLFRTLEQSFYLSCRPFLLDLSSLPFPAFLSVRTVWDDYSALGNGGVSGFNRINQSLAVSRADCKNTFAHFHARAFLLFPYTRNMP